MLDGRNLLGRMATAFLAIGALPCTAGLSTASAATVPPSVGETSCVDGQTGLTTGGPVSCANGGVADVTGMPSVSAVASGPGGSFSHGATASLTYYFIIEGPGSGLVPVIFSANLEAHADFGSNAFAEVVTPQQTYCVASGEAGCTGSDAAVSLTEMDMVNQVLSIHLEAIAGENGAIGGTASAFADPYIYIDPNFADAADYKIVVSSDINNSPRGVPEPATWALMLGGFGLIGGVMRGQRKAAVSFG